MLCPICAVVEKGNWALQRPQAASQSARSPCRSGKVAWIERVLLRRRHRDGLDQGGEPQQLLRDCSERDRSELARKPVIVDGMRKNGAGCWQAINVSGAEYRTVGCEAILQTSSLLARFCSPQFITCHETRPLCAYRWHVPDPVAFRQSLRFLIEQGNGSPPFRSGNYYYRVAYWYQTEPHAPFPRLPSVEEPTSWAAGVKGAIEGEGMKILSSNSVRIVSQSNLL
jgi:hypothetical protein